MFISRAATVQPARLGVFNWGDVCNNGIGDDFEFTPTKRRIFYNIPGAVIELVPDGTLSVLFEKDKDIYTEPEEMVLLTLIKYCSISKEEFEAAIEKERIQQATAGFNVSLEDNELPNADIIYTFNNTIINYYYRRA